VNIWTQSPRPTLAVKWGEPYSTGYWGDSRKQADDLIKGRWLAELRFDFWLNSSPDLHEKLIFKKNTLMMYRISYFQLTNRLNYFLRIK